MCSAKIKDCVQDFSFQLLLKCVFESWEPVANSELKQAENRRTDMIYTTNVKSMLTA